MLTRFFRYLFTIFLITYNFNVFANTKILVFGDSISAGYGITANKDWVSLLANRLKQENINATVINASISGETTEGGVGRLREVLSQHQPHILILELGGNDALRGFPLTIISRNLSEMVELAQQNDVNILLAGMRIPPNYGARYSEQFHQIYLDIAEKYQLALIPFILEGIGGNETLMQNDGIHPSEKAQPQIVDNVWQTLVTLLRD